MNEKVTLQAVSDTLSRQYGVSKKIADAFGKSFFDAIVDALNVDGIVKIKGLARLRLLMSVVVKALMLRMVNELLSTAIVRWLLFLTNW